MEDSEILRFQRALACHCAPALAGIKPADLFSWAGEAQALAEEFARRLGGTGISLRLLCRRGSGG